MPQHIEPDGSCVHIRQAVNMVKGTPHIGPLKTATSIRDVPVPPNVQYCAVFLREQAERLVWESPVFPGQPVNPSYFRDKYRNALFRIPGVRLLTPHSCRHTFVSQLQALGVDRRAWLLAPEQREKDSGEHTGQNSHRAYDGP